MIYGYCRISRKTQNIERQERNILNTFPDAYIIKESFTGTKLIGRKELDKLLKGVKSGDTIVFDSASRMSRNEQEAMDLYEMLFSSGVNLVFLKEPHINSEVYQRALNNQIHISLGTGNEATDKFIGEIIDALNGYTIDLAKEQIRIVFAQAQKEVDDLHKRTAEGLITARLNGKQIGMRKGAQLIVKKAAPAKEKIRKHSKSFQGTLSDQECIKLAGVSRNTFYKYKRELREQSISSE